MSVFLYFYFKSEGARFKLFWFFFVLAFCAGKNQICLSAVGFRLVANGPAMHRKALRSSKFTITSGFQ
ncbi:MAG: hypothetical protein DRI89_13425 [Bacteroidetes bacterium]|nr:MAG: hypothetical protein DRI89_13425 [Bacteroidota bacterium]